MRTSRSSSGVEPRSRRAGLRGSRTATDRVWRGRLTRPRPQIFERQTAFSVTTSTHAGRGQPVRAWRHARSRSRPHAGPLRIRHAPHPRTHCRPACGGARNGRRRPRRTHAIGTGQIEFVRQSMTSTCPARPTRCELVHQAAGDARASTSAASKKCAASSDSSGSPPRSARPSRSATANAQLDDRPEPPGTRRRNAELGARTNATPAASTRTAPATKRPHEGSTLHESSRPLADTTTGPASSCDHAPIAPGDPDAAPHDDAPAIDRHRQAETLVVVRVIAHQVHATGHRVHTDVVGGSQGRRVRALRGRAASRRRRYISATKPARRR